ncbi:MAG: hypothetical protein EOO07_04135 [Chitinophagaceae bacterium]|nr:MAG: hypothetical protein EOO07_04135 [Chitinophagaceae bacterium]
MPIVRAQQQSEYLNFETTGIIGSQIKTEPHSKFVNVLVTGGYVNVHLTNLFKTTSGINGRVYFKDKTGEKIISKSLNGPLYLYPGNEYFFDIYQEANQKLIRRYLLQRPKLYPQIKCYKQDGSLLFTTRTDGKDAYLNLSPSDKIRLEITQRTDFEGMEVEYSLRNLTTKQMRHGRSKYAFKDLVFEGNTDYELQLNYLVQKENASIIYIHVKPHWYQSFVTYGILLIVLMVIAAWLTWLTYKKKINSSQKEQQKLEQAAICFGIVLAQNVIQSSLSLIGGLCAKHHHDCTC